MAGGDGLRAGSESGTNGTGEDGSAPPLTRCLRHG